MSTNETKQYFDLHINGFGYLNRIRVVTPKEGDSFLSVTVAALRGSVDNAQYTRFECRVSGKQAQETVRQLMPAVEGKSKVLIGFTLSDLYAEAFTQAITETLSQFGFIEQYHQDWVSRLRDWLRVDGGFIYFKGSIPKKIRALIRYHGKPLTVEAMLDDIGGGSVRSVRQRLINDPGFWRINKQNQFVIAGTPGYDEYTGITDEIIQELEACGGQAPFDHLVEKLSRVYGVKESSVGAYLNTPMFTKDDNGIVRVRDSDEGIDVSADITKTGACYQGHDGKWYWRLLVGKDVVRGSGRLVPNAFAQLLGCGIGGKIEVESECGLITISWPLASTTGASIGSLRQALVHCDAELGDEPVRNFVFTSHTMNYWIGDRYGEETRRWDFARAAG